MPGDSNYRAQAKYHEKLAKMKKTENPPKRTLSPAILLRMRKGEREIAFNWLNVEFERNKNIGILSRLIKRRKETKREVEHFGRFHVRIQYGVGQHIWDFDEEWMREYMKPGSWTREKEYYEDPKVTDEDFAEKLADEVKARRDSMTRMHETDIFRQFDRTTTRTEFIREELMTIVNKFNCIRACKAVKFEIFAAAFHPNKVWKWLKAGRYLTTIDGEPQHDFNVLNMMAGYDSD